MKVSILMAVYNSASFLQAALESVRAQTLTTWECICVDDGSTDASPEVLRRASETDARIRICRQENAGPAAARNRALEMAGGDAVMVMDADDLLAPRALEILVAALESSQADVAWGQHLVFEGQFDVPQAADDQKIFAGEEWSRWLDERYSQEKGVSNPYYGIPVAAWGKLIRRAALGALRFSPDRAIIGGEDVLFYADLFRQVHSVVVHAAVVYGYRRVAGSLCHRRSLSWLARYAEAYARVAEHMADRPTFVSNFARTAVRPGYVRQALDAFVLSGRVQREADAASAFRQAFERLREAYRGVPRTRLGFWLSLGSWGWWRPLAFFYRRSTLYRKSRTWAE